MAQVILAIVAILMLMCMIALRSLGLHLGLRLFGSVWRNSDQYRRVATPAKDFTSDQLLRSNPSAPCRVEVNEQRGMNVRSILVEVTTASATLAWSVEAENDHKCRFALRNLRTEVFEEALRGPIVHMSGELAPSEVPSKLEELIHLLYPPETILEIKYRVL